MELIGELAPRMCWSATLNFSELAEILLASNQYLVDGSFLNLFPSSGCWSGRELVKRAAERSSVGEVLCVCY